LNPNRDDNDWYANPRLRDDGNDDDDGYDSSFVAFSLSSSLFPSLSLPTMEEREIGMAR